MATIQPVEIQVGGNPVPAYLSVPQGGENHPGIIILSEIFGVNQNIRNVCTYLADRGYAAIALDLFHREAKPVTPYAQTPLPLEKRNR
ncbi:MAG: dienelactone hydrolase family protein [Nitrospinota bacterium]|jgi:carboxymethylenebutenolidase|nr:dienelactone hydrolase family protein [Nitrospinota bacterium]MDP7386814.1 dienelactone hydrolase family protein [Nitrospinota bacterium]